MWKSNIDMHVTFVNNKIFLSTFDFFISKSEVNFLMPLVLCYNVYSTVTFGEALGCVLLSVFYFHYVVIYSLKHVFFLHFV